MTEESKLRSDLAGITDRLNQSIAAHREFTERVKQAKMKCTPILLSELPAMEAKLRTCEDKLKADTGRAVAIYQRLAELGVMTSEDQASLQAIAEIVA